MSAIAKLVDGYHPLHRFFLMCSPAPPPAPDYTAAAQAQGEANIDAARVQGKINNPNVTNPYGTQTVTWGDFDKAGYQAAQEQYNQDLANYNQAVNGIGRYRAQFVPKPVAPTEAMFTTGGDQPTIRQTLSPDQQRLLDTGNRAKIGLSELALQGTDLAKGVLGQNLDFRQLPDRQASAQDAFRQGLSNLMTGVSAMPEQASALRGKIINAMMSRVNEDVDRQKGQLNSSLHASGIAPGSKAYDDAMALAERTRTDAANQAYLSAGQEMSRDFGLDMQRRQQGVNENIYAGNQAAQFAGLDAQRRREALAEMLTQRQMPINEITALMSGSQVSNPFSMPNYAQNAQVQAAPVFGGTQAAGDWNADLYNAKAAQAGNLQSGAMGLGGTALMGGAMMLM